MTTLSRSVFSVAGLAIMLAIAACSDDSNPADNGGGGDTTPPTVSSVTPVDAFHIDVAFSENLGRESAEEEDNYVIIEQTVVLTPASPRDWSESPGDTLRVASASLSSDSRTVSLTTEGSMAAAPYELTVTGVADVSSNEIATPVVTAFTGTMDPDVTAPEIVFRSPNPGATGVGIGAPVTMQFSEPLNWSSFTGGVTWEVTGSGATVFFDVQYDGGAGYALSQLAPLANGTQYTVTLSGVEDLFGNIMTTTSWSFTTTNVADTTPPTLVSSVPANQATSVSVNANLSLTFSEAINQMELLIQLNPDPGDGEVTWSTNGRTLTFDPDLPLLDDQQYNLTILPGGVTDLAGNGIVNPVTIRFTTGSALATGSFAGTLTGDPGSNYASDPTGALVAAATAFPFGGNDDFDILGTDVVATNNTYDILNLPDDVYYPIAVMNTNGDNELDPSSGDAIGAFGVNFDTGDFSPDSITIAGGNHAAGVNFPLFDPSAIAGTVSYAGSYAGGSYEIFVGVFDINGFNPTNPPDYGTTAFWPSYLEWRFNTLDDLLVDGDYYVGAFLDVNGNQQYDSGSDPAGFYGGIVSPTAIHLANGSDAVEIVIALEDATALNPSLGVVWSTDATHAPWFRQLCAAVKQSQLAQKK